jgi:hypothetical protein
VTLEIPVVLTGDFQAPDRTRGTLVVSFFFIQLESHFVRIGDVSYATDPDTGQWKVGGSPALSFVDPAAYTSPDLLAAGGRLAELALVGIDSLAETPVYLLSGRLSDEDGGGALEVSYRIGVDDGLIYRVDLAGQFELDQEFSDAFPLGDIGAGDAAFDAVVTLSDFGKPVNIEAPEITPAPTSRVVDRGPDRASAQLTPDWYHNADQPGPYLALDRG